MATKRNKRKLAAVARETQEENPRNSQSRNTSVFRINEEFLTKVFEEIEGRVSKKTVPGTQQEKVLHFGWSVCTGPISLETSGTDTVRNNYGNITEPRRRQMEPNVHRFQTSAHPEVGHSVSQSHHPTDSDPDKAPHMVTGVQEELPYCSASGKPQKAHSTSQQDFRLPLWAHICDNWSRADFVGASTAGAQLHFSQIQRQN